MSEESINSERRPAAPSADPLADPAWFPYRLDFERGEAVFTRTNRDALAAEPFLDPRWDRRSAASTTLSLEALASAREPDRAPAFIWHTAFCCSTLIADCLDRPDACLSLKEPVALVDLSEAARKGDQRVDPGLVSSLVRLLGRPFERGSRVVIKPSNAANLLIGQVEPAAGPMLLLYSSLERFLLAVVKGGDARRGFGRSLLRARARLPGARFTFADVEVLTDLQAAALIWHLQMQELEEVADRLGPLRARLLDCEDFLVEPARTLAALDEFFELNLGAESIAETLAGPKLRRYAKAPRAPFDPIGEGRGFVEARRILGPELAAVEAWSADLMGRPGRPGRSAIVHGARLGAS